MPFIYLSAGIKVFYSVHRLDDPAGQFQKDPPRGREEHHHIINTHNPLIAEGTHA